MTTRSRSPWYGRRNHARRRSRARSRSGSRTGASEHDYQSPWLHLNTARLQTVLRELDALSDVPPFSMNEFKDGVYGATEHGRGSSRSASHFLFTMARSITAMMHERDEGNSAWKNILDPVMACARRILMKRPLSQRPATLKNLYGFVRNRCDAAAMSTLSERFLSTSSPNLNAMERRLALSMLEIINLDIEAAYTNMKGVLGSS